MRIITLLQSPAGTVLRYLLSFGMVAWLVSRVEWSSLGRLQAIDWRLAVVATLLAGLAYPLQAARWQGLLRAQGILQPGREVHGVFWIAQFYNSFLPGGVAGDAVRIAWLWRAEPARKADAAASLLADRILGLAALLALAAVALGLHLTATPQSGAELETLLAASVVALAAVLGLTWLATSTRWWEPAAARLVGADRVAKLRAATRSLAEQHRALATATLLSVAVWLVDFASLWLLARSVGVEASVLAMTVAAAAAYVAAILPVSIGGHGVREGALVAVLTLLGIGRTQPDTVSVLAVAFFAVSVFWSLAGGVVQLSSLATGWPVPAGSARNSAA